MGLKFLEAFPNLEDLKLIGFNFSTIDRNFKFNLNLKHLEVSQSGVKYFAQEIFSKLFYLQTLDLHGNQLETVNYRIFSQLKQLEEIDVSSNRIENLPQNWFVHNVKLKKINFNRNAIKFVPEQLFEDLTALEEVKFSRNKIKDLGAFLKTVEN